MMIDLRLGDCLELMNGLPAASVDAVITSPPYADLKDYGVGFDVAPEKYPDWLVPRVAEMERVIKPSGSIILVLDDCFDGGFLSPYVFRTVCAILDGTSLKLAQRHYWIKPNARPDNTQRLKNSVENIFQFAKNGYYADKDAVRIPSKDAPFDRRDWKYNAAGADPGNVIYLRKTQNQVNSHPALYPLDVPMRFIKYLTREGDTVLDPFVGSGTTMVACLMLGRDGIGYDINPTYLAEADMHIKEAQLQMVMPL